MQKGTSKIMEHDSDHEPNPFSDKATIERRPVWVRVILLLILLTLVCVGFYFTNQLTVEHYQNR